MKVLITGGSGFIGTNLVEYYLSKGAEVINLDTATPQNLAHKRYWKQVDILDKEGLKRELSNFCPSRIFNLAARTGLDGKKNLQHYRANFEGVGNLLTVTKDLPTLERIIFVSSMMVCRLGYEPRSVVDYCPDTLYGKSKMLGENLVQQSGDLPYSWAIVRPTGIWGPWFSTSYRSLFKLIQKGLYVHGADTCSNQLLGFVGNTVYQLDKLMRASREEVHGKTFYLADYLPTNLGTWTDLIQGVMGARKIRTVPLWILRVLAAIGDISKLVGWNNPPLVSSRLRNMLTSFKFDLDPLVTENLPYTLEEAVQLTVRWLRENE